MISVHDAVPINVVGQLTALRQELHRCLTSRPDALFELVDALLCGDSPVVSLAELSLWGEHRRGHCTAPAADPPHRLISENGPLPIIEGTVIPLDRPHRHQPVRPLTAFRRT